MMNAFQRESFNLGKKDPLPFTLPPKIDKNRLIIKLKLSVE